MKMIQNGWWKARFDERTGKLVWLEEAEGGIPLTDAVTEDGTDMKEGGAEPYRGLSTWIKTGDQPDPNTGVLMAFAPLHVIPRQAVLVENGIRFESELDGIRFQQTWTLKPGQSPLEVETVLENINGAPAPYQIEFFFAWHIPPEEWGWTVSWMPGKGLNVLPPFGDIRFGPSEGVNSAAFFCRLGSLKGAALQAGEGIARYFAGNQSGSFVLGLLSVAKALSPGMRTISRFELWPYGKAQEAAKVPHPSCLAEEVKVWEQQTMRVAGRHPDLRSFAGTLEPMALPRRYLHLTFQYAPVPVDEILMLLDRVVAPLGFTDLIAEIGRAFPYASHPSVGARWAYSRAEWKRIVEAVRAVGLNFIPEYNALGHQRESGLGAAFPEMCEDSGCWCLDVEHPQTQPFLRDLIGELCDFFAPEAFHVGLDEADIPSRPQTFACPRNGRPRDGGLLLAEHVLGLHAFLADRKVRAMMWADMLLYRPEHHTQNGLRTGSWRAIERLPRDIVMFDWCYWPVKGYDTSIYLKGEGFSVVGVTWHIPKAVADFTRFGAEQKLAGMCATTWANPTFRSIPVVCTLMAGRLFRRPFDGPWEAIRDEAEAQAFRLARQKDQR